MKRVENATGPFLLALLLVVGMMAAGATQARATPATESIRLVPTATCSCAAQTSTSSSTSPELRGHGPPDQFNYDEQLGITFAQSFTSLEYNVTAVQQTDPTLGTGPAYLLDGLSNAGYWYQVGVSWDWGQGTGFAMNYEVFDSFGNSIDPANGGGLSQFSGTVNPGDQVVLNLYFDNSSQVVMIAEDLNTGAFAEQAFSAEGGTYFVGLPDGISNSNGFFTGLMTEWYHGAPYYANPEGTVYSTNLAISSGWMWMDEFNGNNGQLVFASNTTAPSTFVASSSQLQEFSYNGTTEYSDAAEFVTGSLPSGTSTGTNTTTSSGPPVTMSFSYSVAGGGSGFGAPVLTYVSNGKEATADLSTTPTNITVDSGTTWSVSSTLLGSTSSERWATNGSTTGTAAGGQVVSLQYQNQFYVTVVPNVSSGGTVSSSGWYDSGSSVELGANASTGWAFEGWAVNDVAVSSNKTGSTTITVSDPVVATATFYIGLKIVTAGSVSVSYSYPTSAGTIFSPQLQQGTVAAGSTDEVYVPPLSTVTVKATPTSFLYTFSGWLGLNTNAGTLVFEISSPGSITAESAVNYLTLGILLVTLALIGIVVALAVNGRAKKERAPAEPAPEQAQGESQTTWDPSSSGMY